MPVPAPDERRPIHQASHAAPSDGPTPRSREIRVRLTLLAAATVVVWTTYWPTLGHEFVYDDYYLVRPHTWSEVRGGLTGSWYTDGVMVPFYRPLTVLFHAARFEILHFDPLMHHGLSLALFTVVASLAGWIAFRVTGVPWVALLGVAAVGTHPGLPYALVAWITNQMHLLQSLVVLGAIGWWVRYRRRDVTWWWPLLVFQVASFCIKEDGIVLLPSIALLEVIYRRVVERRWGLPPIGFLIGSLLLTIGLLALRSWALEGLGGYRAVDLQQATANLARGLYRTLCYQPFDRPGKTVAGTLVVLLTFAGATGMVRTLSRRPDLGGGTPSPGSLTSRCLFLLLAGLVVAFSFNLPFAFVTKREQWYLLAIGGAVAFTGGAAWLLLALRTRVTRALVLALIGTALISSAWVARQMADDFSPAHPNTLHTDGIVVEWPRIAPEVRDFLARKQRAIGEGTNTPRLSDLPLLAYGVHAWEPEPGGRMFRWTTSRVDLYVHHHMARLDLPIRAFPRGSDSVSLLIRGGRRDLGPFGIDHASWISVPIELRPSRWPWRRSVVELSVDPTWKPADLYPGSNDPRVLGMKLGEASSTPGSPGREPD